MNPIFITIPQRFYAERKYIIDIFFREFLGVDFQLKTGQDPFYTISLEKGRIIIEDHFFNHFAGDYLFPSALPLKTEKAVNDFCPEQDMPVLFGNTKLIIQEEADGLCIRTGIDIFAGAFFMLSRWEEYVKTNRDEYERFPVSESLAYQQGFLHRPVVNEYLEFLRKMLIYLGCSQTMIRHQFRVFPTHDIDFIQYKGGYWKSLGKDIFKYRHVKLIRNKLLQFPKPVYDTFDFLMDKSDEAGCTSCFYFIAAPDSDKDNTYYLETPAFQKAISKIRQRGHYIGFHAGYETFNNKALFAQQKSDLEKACEAQITSGRQHYLRFSIPDTWQIYEDCGMHEDATLIFPEQPGFRCGTCYSFPVFNIKTRKQLKVRENPLIMMDTTFMYYTRSSPSEAIRMV